MNGVQLGTIKKENLCKDSPWVAIQFVVKSEIFLLLEKSVGIMLFRTIDIVLKSDCLSSGSIEHYIALSDIINTKYRDNQERNSN